MAAVIAGRIPSWTWILSIVGCVMVPIRLLSGYSDLADALSAIILIATVFAAVFHAEVVALRVGEPFGTLILALAFTIIEVALIVAMMIGGGGEQTTLARDTVFASVMIICNGAIGTCLLAGGIKHHQQYFRIEGVSLALATLAALTVLTLILPNVTASAKGPMFTTPQLVFAGIISLVLYGSFAFAQTIRHREFFLPAEGENNERQGPPIPNRIAMLCGVLLLASLLAVVGLAKLLAPTLEVGLAKLGAPYGVVGIIIAALVLLPEGLAALNAALANQLQSSMNLAMGSALSTIGLTIPAVVVASVILAQPLALGLSESEEVLLALTLLVATVTLTSGKTNVVQGIVHLIIFAAYLFFAVVP